MKKMIILFITIGFLLGVLNTLSATPVTDTIEASTGYFVPTDAQKYDFGYWRNASEDWGWTHTAIGSPWTTAELNVSAFDVDFADGERDAILAYHTGSASWINLGNLAGANDTWGFTAFDLTTYGVDFSADIAAGLQVKIDIDTGLGAGATTGWLVTLAKSSLIIDEGIRPNPQPGAVPEPGTMVLLGFGLIGIAGIGRKKLNR